MSLETGYKPSLGSFEAPIAEAKSGTGFGQVKFEDLTRYERLEIQRNAIDRLYNEVMKNIGPSPQPEHPKNGTIQLPPQDQHLG